jgi:N-acetyl sugar amidotransferase
MIDTFQICTRCVMDTTDPEISFDQAGVCNHCREFDLVTTKSWFPNQDDNGRLHQIVERVKREGAKNEYDCILGLSGGADSSYLALKVKELGLRPLAVHVDGGWNSELAVKNIESVVRYCDFDLHTHVMNWEDMKQLQLAYLRSGVSNQDVPQDHAFFANLYHYAIENKIKYVLSGGNIATEAIFPKAWQHGAMDATNLKAIFARFGEGQLQEYRTISFFQYYVEFPIIRGMRVLRLLNFMPYNREVAIRMLQETGWRPYGYKHGESVFTRFFQNYYLVERFGYDKRKPHLSTLIVTGQMSREAALKELTKSSHDPADIEEDIFYFRKKLSLSEEEFQRLMDIPIRSALEFPSDNQKYQLMKKAQGIIAKVLGRRVSGYS